jgi:hypothetical protein
VDDVSGETVARVGHNGVDRESSTRTIGGRPERATVGQPPTSLRSSAPPRCVAIAASPQAAAAARVSASGGVPAMNSGPAPSRVRGPARSAPVHASGRRLARTRESSSESYRPLDVKATVAGREVGRAGWPVARAVRSVRMHQHAASVGGDLVAAFVRQQPPTALPRASRSWLHR